MDLINLAAAGTRAAVTFDNITLTNDAAAKEFASRIILPIYTKMAEAMAAGAAIVPTVIDVYDDLQLLLMCEGLIPNNH